MYFMKTVLLVYGLHKINDLRCTYTGYALGNCSDWPIGPHTGLHLSIQRLNGLQPNLVFKKALLKLHFKNVVISYKQ